MKTADATIIQIIPATGLCEEERVAHGDRVYFHHTPLLCLALVEKRLEVRTVVVGVTHYSFVAESFTDPVFIRRTEDVACDGDCGREGMIRCSERLGV